MASGRMVKELLIVPVLNVHTNPYETKACQPNELWSYVVVMT